MTTRYVIRFDDITPMMAWSHFAPFDEVSKELGLPFLVGVVPDCRDSSLSVEEERADFWDWLRIRAARGWTIAQHGFTHVYETGEKGVLGIGRKSEFAGLSYQEQYDKLAAGKDILVREGLWHGVFMAPSHSFDQITLKALAALEFTALTDGYGFFAYDLFGIHALPQLLARPLGVGLGVETVCLHVNTLSQAQIEGHIAFLRSNRASIISFEDALAVRPPVPMIAEFARLTTEITLKFYRLARG